MLNEIEEIACSRCGESWPRDEEFFNRDRRRPDGLANICKACVSETRERQLARVGDDPRLKLLRLALRAGMLPSVWIKSITTLFRARGIPTPDARVVARMLELLERERMVRREASRQKRLYRPVALDGELLSQALVESAFEAARKPRRERKAPVRRFGTQSARQRWLDIEWYLKLRQLREILRRTGLRALPIDYPRDPSLGIWVHTQRVFGRRGTLNARRRAFLDRMGFVWSVYDARWEEMYSQLAAFAAVHGHCRIWKESPEHPELGRWIHRQRQMKARNDVRLTAVRIQRLDELGFDWNPIPGKPYGISGWEKRRLIQSASSGNDAQSRERVFAALHV